MAIVRILLDMQMYTIAWQVKWSGMNRWKPSGSYPGDMYNLLRMEIWKVTVPQPVDMLNLMKFFECIEMLMKRFVIDLLRAVYSGPVVILNGKSWMRALHAL